ncbi:MAG: efflux RND transporter periplasmic adaptor subunit [Nitrospirae bacterium]|nr:efflux RND transporter periplasmic adaptor subunit [Nitrospirota bacterium]
MADEDLSKLKIDKSVSPARMGRRRKLLYWVGALLLFIITGFLYFQGVFSPAVQVEVFSVAKIYPSQAFTLLNASGYVVAQRKAAVASKVTGRLISLSVEEGSRVKKNEVIARMENEDALASRDQAEANLNVAHHNLEQVRAELQDATLSFNRYKDLLDKGFVAKADYDASEARYKKAIAAVAAAEAAVKANAAALQGANVMIEYSLIRAPFDAVVLTKNADIGDIVTPIGASANAKAAVVTIADMSSLQVEADVSESNLRQIKVGQPCEIQLDALPDLRFRGVIHMIVPTADRSKATVMVKVRFIDNDQRILPEMSAKVAFLSRPTKPEEQKPLTALNPAALLTRNGKKAVFLIKGDQAVETPVTPGEQIGDMIEVLSGVNAGDKIVLKPLNKIKNGSKIKVLEK